GGGAPRSRAMCVPASFSHACQTGNLSDFERIEREHMNKPKLYIRRYVLSLIAMLCFTSIWYVHSTVLAESLPASVQALPAETWVLERVKKGEGANLKEGGFAERKAERRLSASFLQSLLTEKFI